MTFHGSIEHSPQSSRVVSGGHEHNGSELMLVAPWRKHLTFTFGPHVGSGNLKDIRHAPQLANLPIPRLAEAALEWREQQRSQPRPMRLPVASEPTSAVGTSRLHPGNWRTCGQYDFRPCSSIRRRYYVLGTEEFWHTLNDTATRSVHNKMPDAF
jgi:hypothetical protein